jgi:hypothetical protein
LEEVAALQENIDYNALGEAIGPVESAVGLSGRAWVKSKKSQIRKVEEWLGMASNFTV